MIKNFCLITLMLISSVAAFAQPADDMKLYSMMYPSEGAVILKNDENTTVSFDKNQQLSINKEVYEETFLLSSAPVYSERSVGYSGFNELTELSAKTMLPGHGGYKPLPVTKIETKKDFDDEIFYDDYMNKVVYFPGVQPGAKTILSYKINIKKPQLLGPFFFESYAPCVESSYTITVPDNVHIGYKLFNVNDTMVKFSKAEKNGLVTYTWKAAYTSKFHFEDNAPNARYYLPHLIVYIQDYTVNGVKTNILSSKDDLYKWYYSYVSQVNKSISPQLRHITDSLVAGKQTELDKVKAIYYWVTTNIKYVAFEQGLQGFIPRQADSICIKRYGDCKDMASIITGMLSVAKIPAYLTWIGTRDIPYTYDDVPLPLTDNHMIATYFHDGKPIFLDGTSDYCTFGYPSSFIQGKQAMVSIDSSHYKILEVPIVSKYLNTTRDSIVLNVKDQSLEGKGTEDITGYSRQSLAFRLNRVKDSDMKKAMESYLAVGNNKFKLDTVSVENSRDNDKKLVIDYNFLLQNYIVRTSDEIFVNMNLDKSYFNDFIDVATHKLDKEQEYKYSETHTCVLNFPDGYKLEYQPKNSAYDNDLFGYSINYKQDGDKLVVQKTIYTNYLVLKQDKYPLWNDMIKSLNKAYSEAVILKK